MSDIIVISLFNKVLKQLAFKTGREDTKKEPRGSLQPFRTGGLGNFPYFWQDPTRLSFNIKTFNWINANLKANTYPFEQATGSTFSNLFINALSSISYSLSRHDQDQLNELSRELLTQQLEIVRVWNSIYSEENPDITYTIDKIFEIIINTWANPPVTAKEVENSTDPIKLLNNVPLDGEAVLPSLSSYLLLFRRNKQFLNSASYYAGMLNSALNASQNPDKKNGGMLTTEGYRQAYNFSPSVLDIEKQFNDEANATRLQLEVVRDGEGITIRADGGERFAGQISEILEFEVKDNSELFKNLLDLNGGRAIVEVVFDGLCTVSFHPHAFDQTEFKYWYWMDPIVESIKNEERDSSGYHFLPTPNINFERDGPFGNIVGAVISKLPKFEIELNVKNRSEVVSLMDSESKFNIYFLEQMMEDQYQIKSEIDLSRNGVQVMKIRLEPISNTADKRAYVQGVYVDFPAASKLVADGDGSGSNA